MINVRIVGVMLTILFSLYATKTYPMYGYGDYVELSADEVLQKVTQEQVFEWVLQEPFNYSFRYLSPFRPDTKAGCRFEPREDGTILFVDFGEKNFTGRTHRNCFMAVMDKERCTYESAISKIVDHFQLSTNKSDYKPVKSIEYNKKFSGTGKLVDINYTPKPFIKDDVIYWSQYLIRPEHLREDKTDAVRRYVINNPIKGLMTFTPYKHCYAINVGLKIKIYQPYYGEKGKWITNCDEDDIGNIENLPFTADVLVVASSYKDHRVLRNTIPELNVCWFHNEGCIPSMEIIMVLIQRFKKIIFFYDNDLDGVIAAMKLCDIFNAIKPGCAEMVHLPIFINRRMVHKDPSDFIHKEGRLDLLQVLKHLLYDKVLVL